MPRFSSGRTPWELAFSASLGPPSPVLLVRACFACERDLGQWWSVAPLCGSRIPRKLDRKILPSQVNSLERFLVTFRLPVLVKPVVMSGDQNPKPTNIPCLSKSISQGMCVGLLKSLACWKEEKNQHSRASFIWTTKGSRLDFVVACSSAVAASLSNECCCLFRVCFPSLECYG